VHKYQKLQMTAA